MRVRISVTQRNIVPDQLKRFHRPVIRSDGGVILVLRPQQAAGLPFPAIERVGELIACASTTALRVNVSASSYFFSPS